MRGRYPAWGRCCRTWRVHWLRRSRKARDGGSRSPTPTATCCWPASPGEDQGAGTGRSGACRGGVVELAYRREELLARLAVEGSERGAWAGGLVADIADQYARWQAIFARMDGRPGDRFAGLDTGLDTSRLRDRTCCFPGCLRDRLGPRTRTTPATSTVPAGRPRPPTPVRSAERHHGYKTKGWWRLTQPEPGRFRWISPLGREYLDAGRADRARSAERMDDESRCPAAMPSGPGSAT